MSKLQIKYSKTFAKTLGKIAVYLPGEQVQVGDIIRFPYGNSVLGTPRPLGTFLKVSTLNYLGVLYPKTIHQLQKNTYRFSSKNSVDIHAAIGIEVDTGYEVLPNLGVDVHIHFLQEGAIYFNAVDCYKTQISDLTGLEKSINTASGSSFIWDDTFLVTSVTVADRAFIAQSHSKTSELRVRGDFKGITTTSIEVHSNAEFNIKGHSGDLLIKDWSDKVPVFMNVVRLEKEVFSGKEHIHKSFEQQNNPNSRIRFKPVDIQTLIND